MQKMVTQQRLNAKISLINMQCKFCKKIILKKDAVILSINDGQCIHCNQLIKNNELFCSKRCVLFFLADYLVESKNINNDITIQTSRDN
jgi:endogenous inhibitor of DNA gyrase (YacG/DUF329 family)